MTTFDLSSLSMEETKELYDLVRKFQVTEATATERGWCASVLDKLMERMGMGKISFPICKKDYTSVIEKAYALA
tara:strand:+ start:166 stop:387 length:222 start_codon:yes stop_codon:yes gene_type:complete